MKAEERIILYLDNQMSDEERNSFEKELENSPQLQSRLEKYRKLLGEISTSKNLEADKEYFAEMIPKFRGRLELKQRMRFMPKLAFGMTTLAAVLVVLFFALNRSNNYKSIVLKKTAAQSTNYNGSSDLNILSDQYNLGTLSAAEITYSNSVLDSLLYKELNLTPQSLNGYTFDNNQDLNTVVQGINQKEADEIYDQLLHKKIF